MPGDDVLLQRARAGIEKLQHRYSDSEKYLFYLFHRPRRWNPGEKVWMGYERKRGKLSELNAALRGKAGDAFSVVMGDIGILPRIKYVITLDTDTQLPRDAARQLVGTIAHPLNKPEIDPRRGVVTKGYGILQPRVGVSLPTARRSWFVRLFAGDAGIDPYTRAVSDTYQDIFSEGSFIGKGIYDVDAFEGVLCGRFPENMILSHDLIESCHARSALVSDVELFEEFPHRYNVDADRRHRWIRGDWQIMPWLLPRVPGGDARFVATPLSGLSQWKILDNLRRSLVPAALLVFLFAAWNSFAGHVWMAGAVALLLVAFPEVLSTIADLVRRSEETSIRLHLKLVAKSIVRKSAQIFLAIAFLPYDAYMSIDDIIRSMVRLFITHRRLLEWRTSSDAERSARNDLSAFYQSMWISPALAIGGGILLASIQPTQFIEALPFLIVWTASPWFAWFISQPIKLPPANLSEIQLDFLHTIARKTWWFFETFVNARENWLPPDNFQEEPVGVVASRTSPTNIGLSLLANLAAHDFGYISTSHLIQRTLDTITTMQRMERHRGHFYNWYDTRSLQPLQPLYISTVDSGNLAGMLLTLGAGLRGLADAKSISQQPLAGVRDAISVLRSVYVSGNDLSRIDDILLKPSGTLSEYRAVLQQIRETMAELTPRFPTENAEARTWADNVVRQCDDHLEELARLFPSVTDVLVKIEAVSSLRELGEEMYMAQARSMIDSLESLAKACDDLARMEWDFLYDEARKLFAIGYNFGERRRDAGHYDLLASEARLTSYVAIAQGDVDKDHWFSLGRLLVTAHGEPILVSWSGSMFEYLMPQLIMPNYENTLLDQACAAAVHQQIEYGKLRGVPWGVSESGYNRTDAQSNYQYRAFGVPGTGLKRGLAEDLVIAPYATAMALMIAPKKACENLERLAKDGREGAYGFYEAVDYTPSRMPPNQTSVTIRSFMAHHQGMAFLSLLYLLRDMPMQRRFASCPMLEAADLLLQERVPKQEANVLSAGLDSMLSPKKAGDDEGVVRVFTEPVTKFPEVHLLSNGRYHVAITSAGGGISRWNGIAVTRWREDATRDCWGYFIYIRDLEKGNFWSAAFQPTLRKTKTYEAIFAQGRAEFRQRNNGLSVHTEIAISPEDDIEIRRVTITNRSADARSIELTSYAEVVMTSAAADAAHPAFSNLFVQTEFESECSALICSRRPRSHEEKPPFLLHMMTGQGGEQGEISYETDRSRFVGRGGILRKPAAIGVPTLSNTIGSVLDPIVSLRRTVKLAPNEKVTVVFALGVAPSRVDAIDLAKKYQNPRMADRAFDLSWTHSQVALRQLNASEREAQLYGRLAGALLYANPATRAHVNILKSNRLGQNSLWAYGISGDVPIVLLRIGDMTKVEIVRELMKAHSFWRMKGLIVEVVIVNEDISTYRQTLHDAIMNEIVLGTEGHLIDKPGGIFVRRHEQIADENLILLRSVARIVCDADLGRLEDQIHEREADDFKTERFPPLGPRQRSTQPAPEENRDLLFNNGLGGFTHDGREYVITLRPGRSTPAPWVNVIANQFFGTVVSESGSAYTWLENAHEFRLTPWNNDPVQDPSGEVIYIRDEETGEFWSPTPLPVRGANPYVIRHGFGYTIFEHTESGISTDLQIFVATDAPVKFAVLKFRNTSGRTRRLSATAYYEWVLTDLREKGMRYTVTDIDLKTGVFLARNAYNTDFSGRIAFVDANNNSSMVTGDRKEFIGRNGSVSRPAGMRSKRLSGKVGAGLDPCCAMMVPLELRDGEEREITFRLGVGRNAADVQTLIQRFRAPGSVRTALEGVWTYWNRTLGAVHVETPDPSVNVMANGWLLYQTLSCRMWGRTGFYQSGGAYGFRDQLQDSMALIYSEPGLVREHLIRAAGHQFPEGDVQHWWHPPSSRGVRTHFSDDFLWLPFVTCHYVFSTADTGLLEESVPFLEGRPLKPEEEAYYDLPVRAEETASLYDHCVRAIENGMKFGEHGLPLIGCGDWNDGMNKVGAEGRGESVWLAFFFYTVLKQFANIALMRNDSAFADRCHATAATLQQNIERNAWDGEWYLRAYFDNGEPLGSAENEECQIDSLPQSWSVISGAGDASRSYSAMEAVDDRLIRREDRLIQLFDPPFDHSALDPGYIKGYVPGVRENGGQYTHGAIWTVMAFALMGQHDRAWELFALLNPVNHGSTPEQILKYKVEPYVVAADIYAVAPHTGRGGWTWYTGSAGWMYRLIIETLLGLKLEGTQLRITPRLPKAWNAFTIHYRFRRTHYQIVIQRSATQQQALTIDHERLRELLGDAERRSLLDPEIIADHERFLQHLAYPAKDADALC
ncbi:MAG: glucoamylase family protein, partial [Candidatus Sumerlaeota bacterium]